MLLTGGCKTYGKIWKEEKSETSSAGGKRWNKGGKWDERAWRERKLTKQRVRFTAWSETGFGLRKKR